MNEQSIQLCKTCTARKLDFNRGLLCGVTDAKPHFEKNCDNYNEDSEILQKIATKENEQEEDKAVHKRAMGILLASCSAILIKLLLLYFSIEMMRQGGYVIINCVVIAFFCVFGTLAYYKTDFFKRRFRLAIMFFGEEPTRWIVVSAAVVAILFSYYLDLMTILKLWM